jgi:phytanoyl-CoA hydroxylase
MLTQSQIDTYHHDGYLKVEKLLSSAEVDELNQEMRWLIDEWWGEDSIGWRGPWRKAYLDEDEQETTKAVFISNPHTYSATWSRILFHTGIVGALQHLIGRNIQWHHTVLHAKPPEKGTPFPMHQDFPFYPHDGPDFVDCLVHLDETPLESGALRVVPGSHKAGPIEHITGEHTRPYLPPEIYHPDITDSVPIPANPGDVIFFSYYTIHWSDVNRTDQWRKSVRIGYHTPETRPIGKPPEEPNNNLMVSGTKAHHHEPKLTYE